MNNLVDKQIEENITLEALAYALPGAWAQYNLGEENWKYAPHIEAIEDKLLDVFQGKINRLMISIGTQYGKSTLVSKAFSSWYLARKPNTRIVITSYDTDFASELVGESREWLELNGPNIFGVGVDPEQRSKKHWAPFDPETRTNKYIGEVRGIGCGAGLAGKPVDLLIIEDVIKSNAQAESRAYLDMIEKWFNDDIEGRITPQTKVVVVQTRRAVRDLIGILIDKEKKGGDKWEKLFLPEIAEEDDPLGRSPGEPLWPSMRPLDWCLQKKKNMTPFYWSTNRQCKPIQIEGNRIKTSWFRRYITPPKKEEADEIIVSIDTANSDSEVSDYSVIMIWAIVEGNKYYLVDLIRERMTFPTLQTTVEDVLDIWKANNCLVENKGHGSALIQHLEEYTSHSVERINPTTGNKMLLESESPAIRSGRVYIPDEGSTPWVYDLEAEIQEWPNGRFDDQADCMAIALKWLREESAPIEIW